MKNQKDKKQVSVRMKWLILILSVLLVVSAGGLTARMIYLKFFAPAQATVILPDNLIGENPNRTTQVPSSASPAQELTASFQQKEPTGSQTIVLPTQSAAPQTEQTHHKATKLELYKGHPGDNEKFEVRNLFPGDCITKYFCIKAYHDADITLFFNAEVTEQTKALGDVLHIKVTRMETGEALCDAPFSEIKGKEFSKLLKKNEAGESVSYYEIAVSLDPSVGNEYQSAMLKADFNWYAEEDDGLVSPPQTGDRVNILLWTVLALSSLAMILLLLPTRRKEAGKDGQV